MERLLKVAIGFEKIIKIKTKFEEPNPETERGKAENVMASGGMNVKFNIMQQFGNSLRKKERKKRGKPQIKHQIITMNSENKIQK